MKISTPIVSALFLALGATLASAHGYVQNVTIGNQVYQGWLPFDSPYTSPPTQSVIRKIRDDGPVTDITDPALSCNYGGAAPAALTADANAGDNVKFTMVRWPSDHLGPVSVYMASCGTSCDSFDTTGNVWFKIEEETLTDGVWATTKLINDNLSWTTTIPKSIQGGQYLMRFELLALHSAGAPQFYPSCTQLNIKGSGSGVAIGSELVSIPGLYANAGNAIYGDIWEQPTSWPPAGPAVAKFVGGGGDDGGATTFVPAASTSAVGASTTAAATTTKAAATTKASTTRPVGNPAGTSTTAQSTATAKTCKLKKKTGAIKKRALMVKHAKAARSAALRRVADLQQQKREREAADGEVYERSWGSLNKAKSAHSGANR